LWYDGIVANMLGTIYCITNLVNGKKYVGKTTLTIKARWRAHRHSAQSGDVRAICAAIQKYGEDSFSMVQIDSAESMEELNSKEVLHIACENSLAPNGYNETCGGDGAGTPSKELRSRLSRLARGKTASEETRKRMSEAWIIRKVSPETCKKISSSKKQTHCRRGHLLDEGNTYIYPDGRRACRLCRKRANDRSCSSIFP
jgi:group I intron endonuclease